MRTLANIVLLLVAGVPAGASAQLSNRSVAVETNLSAGRSGRAGLFAVAASHWLDGDVHLTARVMFGGAPETTDRAAASALGGTAGLAWAPGTGRVRARLFAEAGWVRLASAREVRTRGALGAGGVIEWFLARDFALHAGVAARRWEAWRLDLLAGAALHF